MSDTETWILYRCSHRSLDDEPHPTPSPADLVECGAYEYVAPGFPAPNVCSKGHILKMVPEGEYELEVSA